jgi:hypothetical protein
MHESNVDFRLNLRGNGQAVGRLWASCATAWGIR